MKKIIVIFLAIAGSAGCGTKDTPKSVSYLTVSTITDFSDKRNLWPTPGPILQLLGCDKNPDMPARVHLVAITDKRVNPDYTVSLPSALETEDQNGEDGQSRNRAIVSFYADVHAAFGMMYKQFDTTHTIGNSEIFSTVCQELKWLQKKPGTRSLVIFSNLIEHGALFDGYAMNSEQGTSVIVAQFNATHLLPSDLSGIMVYCVNAPHSKTEDRLFAMFLAAYRTLIESRGGQVITQANNQTYLP